jgi:hypothetical protein
MSTQTAEQLAEQFDTLPVEVERRLALIRNELKASNGSADLQIRYETKIFEIAFTTAMDWLAEGKTLQEFCVEYHTPISPARFRKWIFQDDKRHDAYRMAKALGAEAMEDELVRISDGLSADGSAAPDETARSKLKIDTRKFVMQVNNRRKYGEHKSIEQTTTTTTKIDVTSLSTEDLKRYVLRQAGADAVDVDEVMNVIGNNGDDDGDS